MKQINQYKQLLLDFNSIKDEAINVLSIFDGISCTKVALDRLNIPIKNYFAAEIDKYAIKISRWNYSNIIHLGCVKEVKGDDLPQIDLLIGGFPCQSFSVAGKQLNFEDPRGQLFFECVRLLKECNPRYFLFENVKMKKEYQQVINNLLGVEPLEINSALVSAQHRRRLYWAGQRTEQGNYKQVNIPQPEDKKIYLKDIIQSGITDREKSYCITANAGGISLKRYFTKSMNQLIFDKPHKIANIGNGGQGNRVYDVNGKSVCLNAVGGGGGAKTGLYAIAQAKNKKKVYVDNNLNIPTAFYEARTEKGKQARKQAKMNTGKDTTPRDKDSKMYLNKKDNKANCLVTVDSFLTNIIDNNYIIRKLTPIECERLQTLPDNFTYGISNTQRYKALGNGFTVNVIAHILSFFLFQ